MLSTWSRPYPQPDCLLEWNPPLLKFSTIVKHKKTPTLVIFLSTYHSIRFIVHIICSSQDVFITSTVQFDSHTKKGTCLLSQLRNSEFFKYINYFAGCRVGPVVEGAKLEGIRIRNGTLEFGLGERARKFAWCRRKGNTKRCFRQ